MYLTIENNSGRICGTSETNDTDNMPNWMKNEYHMVDINDIISNCKTEEEKINRILINAELFYYNYFTNDGDFIIEIEWGDWKHDHKFCDDLMTALGYSLKNETVTDEDESDCYSATHIYKRKEMQYNDR